MYLLRTQELKNTEFPENTKSTIIIRGKGSGVGFRTDYPENKDFGKRISVKDFHKHIDNVHLNSYTRLTSCARRST